MCVCLYFRKLIGYFFFVPLENKFVFYCEFIKKDLVTQKADFLKFWHNLLTETQACWVPAGRCCLTGRAGASPGCAGQMATVNHAWWGLAPRKHHACSMGSFPHSGWAPCGAQGAGRVASWGETWGANNQMCLWERGAPSSLREWERQETPARLSGSPCPHSSPRRAALPCPAGRQAPSSCCCDGFSAPVLSLDFL